MLKKAANIRQLQDQNKLGWSRRKRLFAYACFGAVGLKIYTAHYRTDIMFTCQHTQNNVDTIQHCPSLRFGKYQPTFYLPSAFLQAAYGSLFDDVPYIPITRKPLVVDEQGGTITLDYVPVHLKYLDSAGQDKQNMRVLIIFHGLTGASECNYIRQTALYASRKGFRAICVNMRGFAHSKLTSPKITDYASINDVQHAVEHIRAEFPDAKLYLLGYSMGSSLMLRYLQHNSQHIQAAVGISVPWSIQELASEITKPQKRIYDFAITRNFKRNLTWNIDIFEADKITKSLDIEGALKASRIRDFDELFTRRVHELPSIEDLYSRIDCRAAVKSITKPLLLISALDDPVIMQPNFHILRHTQIPKEDIVSNPNILLAQTRKGGHIEWFTGFRPIRWVIKPAVEFLDYKDRQTRAL